MPWIRYGEKYRALAHNSNQLVSAKAGIYKHSDSELKHRANYNHIIIVAV
jgi:hypothetical protein